MIKYSVEIHSNKKKKEKANYPIFPIFSELSQIYPELIWFLSEQRVCGLD